MFSGIGGFDLGFESEGFTTSYLIENNLACRTVLRERFPGAELLEDISAVRAVPRTDAVVAGFPCQPLSQAGNTLGLAQLRHLLEAMFRLIRLSKSTWIVLENVPFLLHLQRGAAVSYIIEQLEAQGLRWAYRLIDSRSFGLPQRRLRWLLVASRKEDPRWILSESAFPRVSTDPPAFGFYWTEGNRGLGWTVDAIPPLKVGSAYGIPSTPAVWIRKQRRIGIPGIADAERLQGFPVNWTKVDDLSGRPADAARWRQIGNAVNVELARFLGLGLTKGTAKNLTESLQSSFSAARWPKAAYGSRRERVAVEANAYPVWKPHRSIAEFIEAPIASLSTRAASGFLERANHSSLRFTDGFLDDVAFHVDQSVRR